MSPLAGERALAAAAFEEAARHLESAVARWGEATASERARLLASAATSLSLTGRHGCVLPTAGGIRTGLWWALRGRAAPGRPRPQDGGGQPARQRR